MQIDILSLFPEMALGPLGESMISRAQESGIVTIRGHNLRNWATGKNRRTDDSPCGGGPGMVLLPGPLFDAIHELRTPSTKVILMSPQGKPLKQSLAKELSVETHLLLVCGHYEGVDHRVIEELVDIELSLGDYILTNGAIAAAVVTDAVVRLLPGVLGDSRSAEEESFSDPSLLEAPVYTKPANFRGLKVPPVLLSGNHRDIAAWKAEQSLRRTQEIRPELLE